MNKRNLYLITAWILLGFGAFILVVTVVLFLLKTNSTLSLSKPISSDYFDHFGSFTGGTVGILWSLAGVILLIDSLLEQRRATEYNIGQVKLQQFESTFFQFISSYYDIVRSIEVELLDIQYGEIIKKNDGSPTIVSSTAFFEEFCVGIKREFDRRLEIIEGIDRSTLLIQVVEEFFYIYSADLEHYYGNIRMSLQFIESAENNHILDEEVRIKYISMIRNQLSNYEIVALGYYIFYNDNDSLRYLVQKFRVIDRLDRIIKIEQDKSDKWEPIIVMPKHLRESILS